jgi:hypothetical protein
VKYSLLAVKLTWEKYILFNPLIKDEAQTALFKDPVRTAL